MRARELSGGDEAAARSGPRGRVAVARSARLVARVAVGITAGALLAGCSSGSEPEPPPPSAVRVATADVEAQLVNDLQGDRYYGWDRGTWQRARDAATSLPWQVVTAAGVAQAVACLGEGQPTVVYVNGWETAAAQAWPLAATEQARSGRVCLFDRPGNGLSPARRGAAPHSTPMQQAEEMLALLRAVGEPGPYVLVPWAYGGLVARSAASGYPDHVAGMVLVDAVSPLDRALAEQWQGENGIVDTYTVAASLGGGPFLGNRPLIVLEAGRSDPQASAARVKEWQKLQRQATTMSENAVHAVVDDAGPAIPMTHPQAVVAATTAVVESVRAGDSALPACPAGLATAGATCSAS